MHLGDKVQIVVEGTIRQIGRHKGICYEVELNTNAYRGRRMLWVDSSEVATASVVDDHAECAHLPCSVERCPVPRTAAVIGRDFS